MKKANLTIADANEAVTSVAYRVSETIAIYPITPSSPMAELSDEWSNNGKPNLWGTVPSVCQMQSEAGVAGAVHGFLQAGTLTTTFTASQGLLLMIPNMYKIAGELTPFCMHVSARAIAAQGLSIFGDQGDVMAARQTGFAMLASNSVQEAQDMAAISHSATFRSRVPFMHFFDGFRTSHEINSFIPIPDETLRELMNPELIEQYRERALSPDHPIIRGTAQNPDVYFQGRESVNPYYLKVPQIVEDTMSQFEKLTGRSYKLYEYEGDPNPDRIIIIMGSGAETIAKTSEYLSSKGEKTGVLKVRLFRPFSVKHFVDVLPKSVKAIAVLDRTKEPGSLGEPLYLDIIASIQQAKSQGLLQQSFNPVIVGGRYGLGSKEFTPGMVLGVFEELNKPNPKHGFTVGIIDDVTGTSLHDYSDFDLETKDVFRAVFFGLGSDGTVGANKNSIKIIGQHTDNYAQAYFVYDSKKAGAVTVSHLRFGPSKIRAPYLIKNAQFVGCHQFQFIDKYDIISYAQNSGILLINSPFSEETFWQHVPLTVQQAIIDKRLKVYIIDAYKVARDSGMGGRTNTIMQTCFFAISGILPREEAIGYIKSAIKKTYSKRGEEVVLKNYEAVDNTLANLHEIKVPEKVIGEYVAAPTVSAKAPDFVKRVTAVMMEGKGDLLPVSAIPADGTWPTATTQWEKRNIAQEVPIWDPEICIQCNKCALVCPHAAIRAKFYSEEDIKNAPESFQSVAFRSKEYPGSRFTIQVAPEDCTGCSLCVTMCPAKSKTDPNHKAINMTFKEPLLEREKENYAFFLNLKDPDTSKLGATPKDTQFRKPLFEYSGACAGCGETPYIKLLTQLYGDRLVIANATGCSSIYGGNLPTTPYTVNEQGRGPAWANSLFEDNAEFGFGIRFSLDKENQLAKELLQRMAPQIGDSLVQEILSAPQSNDTEINQQRVRVAALKEKLKGINSYDSKFFYPVADALVKKSVWIMGGDGWAYDIGFGGLDHVIASGKNVNILVLDTEVYSNTGGQMSKSTPIGAIAKFATGGKQNLKKDLGMIAMSYGQVYVASVAMGARDTQTVQAFQEAESFDGPSLIIAYSPCVAHGYNLSQGMDQQILAVKTGYWPLYRYDPRRLEKGEAAFKIDYTEPKTPIIEYLKNETRFKTMEANNPDHYQAWVQYAQDSALSRYRRYLELSKLVPPAKEAPKA